MTKQQERARARRRYEKQQAGLSRQAADRARLSHLGTILGTVLVVVLVLAALGGAFSRVDPGVRTNAAGCTTPPPVPGTGAQLSLPDAALAAGTTWTATLTTNCGDIVVDLDGAAAPQAVASFIQLARADYWLNSPCHRLLRSGGATVLHCGDPTGTGQGTPGYGFAVENAPKDGVYQRGQVAMARTNDPTTGNGGQFFFVDARTTLPDPAGYSVFGQVVSGLDIVDRIVAEGIAGGASTTDGVPAAPISILRVAVTEKKA